LNADPVSAHANAEREAVRNMAMSQSLVVGALPGQTVVIRYPRLPQMPEEQIGETIRKDAGQHIPYDLAEVFLDWSLLDTVTEGSERLLKVLLVAAKHEVIDSRVQIATAAEIPFGVLSVDSLALADAAECCDFLRVGETVALVNIGLTSASIHFVKDGISSFIRDVNWGARELIQAITRARRCEYEQAERLLHEADSCPAPPPPPSSEEAIPQPGPGAPTPPPLRGSALLDPFEDESTGRRVPGAVPAAAESGTAEKSLQEILVSPLSRLVSEIRRSFDYYEHELYENPVDRLILSGGIAGLPILSNTLTEELGLQQVEVANPMESALFTGDDRAVAPLQERPAQFMVAIGLAARGLADL
jgi:type IV pilus assembly protein PilM